MPEAASKTSTIVKQSISFKEYVIHIAKGKGINIPLGRTFLFSLISIFLVNFVTNNLLLFTSNPATSEAYLTQLDFAPTLFVLIVGVIVMPFYEEIVFRLFLVPSPTKILVSVSLIVGLVIGYFLMAVYSLGSENPIFVMVILPIVLAPLIALLLVIPFKNGLFPSERISTLSKIQIALNRDIRPAYYISAILFSIAHIAFQELLFPMTTSIIVIMFINYSLVGLVLGNVRLSKGIEYAIIIHSIVNFLAYLKVFV